MCYIRIGIRARVCIAAQMATFGNQTLGDGSDDVKNLWVTLAGLDSRFEQYIEKVSRDLPQSLQKTINQIQAQLYDI